MMRIIQKYGGSSLASPELLASAAKRIIRAAESAQIVAVVSAQGKTTDHLLAQAGQLCGSGRELDQLLACGEQMAAALLAGLLNAMGCPAISLTGPQMGLLTEGPHGDATPIALTNDRIERELAACRIVVVTGFQGIDVHGDVTTLGRGGSDTTAVALCHLLGAERCMIFTDVDGIYTADPHKNPTAVRLPQIGYEQMLTMARNGAKVLHDRSVELAMRYGVPIEVCSAFTDSPGTLVH